MIGEGQKYGYEGYCMSQGGMLSGGIQRGDKLREGDRYHRKGVGQDWHEVKDDVSMWKPSMTYPET